MDLSTDVDRFLRDLRSHIRRLSAELTSANGRWEDRESTFQQTHATFDAVLTDIELQSAAIGSSPTRSVSDAVLNAIRVSLGQLELAAQAVIDGLEAPDEGSQRAEAIDGWSDALNAFEIAATIPETSTTAETLPLSGTTTSLAGSTLSVPADQTVDSPGDVQEAMPPDAAPGAGPGAWLGLMLLVGVIAYGLGRRRRRSDD